MISRQINHQTSSLKRRLERDQDENAALSDRWSSSEVGGAGFGSVMASRVASVSLFRLDSTSTVTELELKHQNHFMFTNTIRRYN